MIFIDSSVLIAYFVEKDTNHNKAVNIIDQISKGKFESAFCSDYVFDETVTGTLVRSKSIKDAISAGNYIKSSLEILKIGESTFDDSWKLFSNQKFTKFSFTDCTNISIMNEYDIKHIATFDNEFKKGTSFAVLNESLILKS